MRLLSVISSYYPAFQYGGPIISVHTLNKMLVKRGIDVTVYTTNAALRQKVLRNKEVIIDGVKVNYFTQSKFLEFLDKGRWQFSLPMSKALEINLKNFDLVYIVGMWNYCVAAAVHYCRKFKKPYIISPRGLLYPYATEKKSWKKWPYYYILVRRDLKNAAAIHYTTEDEAKKCHAFLGLRNKAVIIPNGIDLSEFSNLPEKGKLRDYYAYLKDKKVILFLSRINWKKGMDILIKAYSRIAKERSDVELLIVGNDEAGYIKLVKRWIRKYNLEERVSFTGMLLGRDKLEAFVGSDLFVLPSYSENFGMSVVEAMACGVPVVISNMVGIYKEVQKNKAGIVVECNEISLYEGIMSILNNHRLAEELSYNARKTVEVYYNIDKVADKMIEAFEEILSKK